MGKHVHLLSDLNPEARTAICASCGPVKVIRGGVKGGWRCYPAHQARQTNNPERHAWQAEYRSRPGNREKAKLAARRHWLSQYGLTLEQYAEMEKSQDGKCWICHLPEKLGQRLSVDHDAETGAVRGLLCRDCNRGIGLLRHDPERLRRAALYLERAATPPAEADGVTASY